MMIKIAFKPYNNVDAFDHSCTVVCSVFWKGEGKSFEGQVEMAQAVSWKSVIDSCVQKTPLTHDFGFL